MKAFIDRAVEFVRCLNTGDVRTYWPAVEYTLRKFNIADSSERFGLLVKILEKGTFRATASVYKGDISTGKEHRLGEIDSSLIKLFDDKELHASKDGYPIICRLDAEKSINSYEIYLKTVDVLDIKNENRFDKEAAIDGLGRLNNRVPFVKYCLKVASEDSLFWNKFSDMTLYKTYTYLLQSLLSGEFILLSDYSEKVLALKYESEINDDRLPEIIYWLDCIKDELKGFCDLMKIILNPYNSSTVGLTRNSAIWQNDNDVSSLGKNLFKLFRLSVCMTTIDLKYYANPHNRKSLIELIDIIRISLDVPEPILQFLKDSGDEDSLFASVLGDLQFKACNLLNGMLNDKYEDALKFRIISKEIKDIVEQNVIDSENITNPFTFVYLHGTCHDYDKLREDIIDKNRIEYNDANRTDLTSYNRYLDVSYMAYCKISSMYDRKSLDRLDKDGVLYDRLDELLVDANDVNIYSSTFFATVIPYVYDKIINAEQDKDKQDKDKQDKDKQDKDKQDKDKQDKDKQDKNWYVLLCRLFLKCREYIQIYRHWHNIPLVYRPLFECSFVKRSGREWVSERLTSEIIDNYGSGGVKDDEVKGVFFASLGYESINIDYLENVLFRYNNKWHIKMGDNMRQQLHDIRDTKEGVSKALDGLNKTVGSIPEQFVDERKRTVQLLGIFGAMLAFVSSVIGMQKIVKSSLDFALFCCMFVMCLLIFVLGIQYITLLSHRKDSVVVEKQDSIVGWHLVGCIIGLVVINLVLILIV